MEDRRRKGNKRAAAAGDELGGGGGGGDPEVWKSFEQRFRQVQSVLDRNRSLIEEVKENQKSRIPDNMTKNVALIQELNGNISKVVSLYSDLGSTFSGIMHAQKSPNPNPDS